MKTRFWWGEEIGFFYISLKKYNSRPHPKSESPERYKKPVVLWGGEGGGRGERERGGSDGFRC